MTQEPIKTYLGDGIHAKFDGWDIELRVQHEFAEHYIVLEPESMVALYQFAKRCGWKADGS
jgi:hypothetical protein